MILVYGISNCDTVKKARTWLDQAGVTYQFHDFKKMGVPPASLDQWIAQVGWEKLVNRQGMMWRKLDDAAKAAVVDAAAARALMMATPSVIKRPVVEARSQVLVGFDAAVWSRVLK
jgi:arsenate reductase (glutaredoxin)